MFLQKAQFMYISNVCTHVVFCNCVQPLVREKTAQSASLKFLCSFRFLLVLNRFVSTKLPNNFEIQALLKQFSLKIFSNKILCGDFPIWFLFACLFLFVGFFLVISHSVFPFQYEYYFPAAFFSYKTCKGHWIFTLVPSSKILSCI